MKNIKYRLFIFYSVFFFVIGLIGLLIKDDLYHYFNLRPPTVLLLSVILLLTGISIFLMLYIRGGIFPFTGREDEYGLVFDSSRDDKKFEILREELLSKLSDFKDLDEIKKEIRITIDQQVSKLSEEKIIQQFSDRYNNELLTKSKLDLIDIELGGIKHRIGCR